MHADGSARHRRHRPCTPTARIRGTADVRLTRALETATSRTSGEPAFVSPCTAGAPAPRSGSGAAAALAARNGHPHASIEEPVRVANRPGTPEGSPRLDGTLSHLASNVAGAGSACTVDVGLTRARRNRHRTVRDLTFVSPVPARAGIVPGPIQRVPGAPGASARPGDERPAPFLIEGKRRDSQRHEVLGSSAGRAPLPATPHHRGPHADDQLAEWPVVVVMRHSNDTYWPLRADVTEPTWRLTGLSLFPGRRKGVPRPQWATADLRRPLPTLDEGWDVRPKGGRMECRRGPGEGE